MWGFDNLKDVIEVLIIPLALGGLGVFLPKYLEKIRSDHREEAFIKLICRELKEMAPKDPKSTKDQKIWTDHLHKRFIHEEIFGNPSENRDFILSLEPDLTYHMAQLWINFKKAADKKKEKEDKKETLSEEDFAEIGYYGAEWCHFLKNICFHLEKWNESSPQKECEPERESLYADICVPWEDLIIRYHPEVSKDIRPKEKAS